MCWGCQVRSGIGGNVLRSHHAESAAGERERRRRLSGGQDDQPHETWSLHRHCECWSSNTLTQDAFTYAVFNWTLERFHPRLWWREHGDLVHLSYSEWLVCVDFWLFNSFNKQTESAITFTLRQCHYWTTGCILRDIIIVLQKMTYIKFYPAKRFTV